MPEAHLHTLHVWGDLACFTRPELKVERFSYPVMTPSAARGIFDAVYCKPIEFRWQIRRIEVLSPPSWIPLRRNEAKEKIDVNQIASWMQGGHIDPILADGDRALTGSDEKGRTQRQTMALRDVRYRVSALIRPWPGFEPKQQAFDSQFRRRASKGKCFYQPCFGCREFPAFFELDDATSAAPVPLSMDLGLMLYDVFDLGRPGKGTDLPRISLFRAVLRDGVLEIPNWTDPSVLKPETHPQEAR